MTKEEAIRILKNFSLCGVYHQLIHMNDTDSEAISMAIKALLAEDNQASCRQVTGKLDTISRQDAIDALARTARETFNLSDEFNHYLAGLMDGENAIRQLPSAQPEIIRCRDCKFWREHKYAKETKEYIPFCGFNAIYTKADDFCSRAERRIDER